MMRITTILALMLIALLSFGIDIVLISIGYWWAGEVVGIIVGLIVIIFVLSRIPQHE
jgi:uncharacterized membrane protein